MTDSGFTRNTRAFPELEPPPYGLTRLRAKLDATDRRRARLLALAFVPSLAAAAAVVVLVVTKPQAHERAPFDVDAVPALVQPTGHVVAGAREVPLSATATFVWVP